MVSTYEDTAINFSPVFCFQVLDPDTPNFDFGAEIFELSLNVKHGTLTVNFVTTTNVGRSIILQGSMCDLNEALQTLKYTPDAHYNSEFGIIETLQLKVARILAGYEQAASLVNCTVKVLAVDNIPVVTLHEPSFPILTSQYLDIHIFNSSGSDSCNVGSVCFGLYDLDSCEIKYRVSGLVPPSMLDVEQNSAALCANSSLPGNILVTFTVLYGDVWFFSRYSTQAWPPGPSSTPPDSVGRSMQVLSIQQPLAWFLGGVLRYYASEELRRIDSVSITIDDMGFTGKRRQSGFCCCLNQSCSVCASSCNLFFDSRFCEASGNICRGEVPSGIPGFGIVIICFMLFASVFAVIQAFFLRSTSMDSQNVKYSNMKDNTTGTREVVVGSNNPETVLAI